MNKDVVAQLSTVHFRLGMDLQVIEASQVLTHYYPEIEGSNLMDSFVIHRPSHSKTFDDFQETLGEMVLISSAEGNFAARGQFVLDGELDGKDDKSLIFVGAPWLSWMTKNCPETQLRVEDFSATDVQLDQMIFVSTERQNLEDLKELNEELTQAKEHVEKNIGIQSEFFALMSHEMRTPLNGIAASLELMDSSVQSAEEKRIMEMAQISCENLKQVVDRVLNYSKLEAGGFANEPMAFNLEKMLSSVAQLNSPSADRNLTKISVENELVNSWLRADETKLKQVLINLVSNAVKFTRGGEIKIRSFFDHAAGTLHLEVSDTGQGIPEESLDEIFNIYLTFGSKRDLGRGTGLGLCICKRFVELMGGGISVESTLGKGTRFFIVIPAQPIEVEQQPEESIEQGKVRQFSGNVLLVEDNETNQLVGKMLLERSGLSVRVASNGQEALDSIKNEQYDLVLMDISMPVMDGYEATSILRQQYSSLDLPIVALTAHAGEDEHSKILDAGMNAVILKPIEKSALNGILSRYCSSVSEPVKKIQQTRRVPTGHRLVIENEANKLIDELGWETYRQIAELFSEEAKTTQGKVVEAYKANNLETLAKAAHSIRSTAATVGCLPLADYLKTLELTARDGNVGALQDLMEGFSEYMALTLRGLKEFISRAN